MLSKIKEIVHFLEEGARVYPEIKVRISEINGRISEIKVFCLSSFIFIGAIL